MEKKQKETNAKVFTLETTSQEKTDRPIRPKRLKRPKSPKRPKDESIPKQVLAVRTEQNESFQKVQTVKKQRIKHQTCLENPKLNLQLWQNLESQN